MVHAVAPIISNIDHRRPRRTSPPDMLHRPCCLTGAGAPTAGRGRGTGPVAPRPKRGRAERRTKDASAASCARQTSARVSHHGAPKTSGVPHARWASGLLRALPRGVVRLGSSPSGLSGSDANVETLPPAAGRRAGAPSIGASDGRRNHTSWAGAQR